MIWSIEEAIQEFGEFGKSRGQKQSRVAVITWVMHQDSEADTETSARWLGHREAGCLAIVYAGTLFR